MKGRSSSKMYPELSHKDESKAKSARKKPQKKEPAKKSEPS